MDGNQQLAAVRANIAVLGELGITDVTVSNCPECGLSNFTSAEHGYHVCGYCGYGPWQGGKAGKPAVQ